MVTAWALLKILQRVPPSARVAATLRTVSQIVSQARVVAGVEILLPPLPVRLSTNLLRMLHGFTPLHVAQLLEIVVPELILLHEDKLGQDVARLLLESSTVRHLEL